MSVDESLKTCTLPLSITAPQGVDLFLYCCQLLSSRGGIMNVDVSLRTFTLTLRIAGLYDGALRFRPFTFLASQSGFSNVKEHCVWGDDAFERREHL